MRRPPAAGHACGRLGRRPSLRGKRVLRLQRVFRAFAQIGVPWLWSRLMAEKRLGGCDHLGESHRAKPVEQREAGVERGRYGRGLDPAGGDPAGPLEMFEGCQSRRGPLAGDDSDPTSLGVVNHDRHFATKTERPRVGHAQSQDRRGPPVSRISPFFQDFEPRRNGVVSARGDGPLRTRRLPFGAAGNGRCLRPAPRWPRCLLGRPTPDNGDRPKSHHQPYHTADHRPHLRPRKMKANPSRFVALEDSPMNLEAPAPGINA